MKRIFAAIMSVMMLASCTVTVDMPKREDKEESGNDVRTINLRKMSVYDDISRSEADTVLSTTYQVLMTSYDDEKKFRGLQDAFDEFAEKDDKRQSEFIGEYTNSAKDAFENDGEYFIPYEHTKDAYVRRADTVVTSILYHTVTYTGGAHGSLYCSGVTCDTESGEELELSDVVNDTDELPELISEQLELFYEDTELNGTVTVEEALQDDINFAWTLDYNGITFFFNPDTVYINPSEILTVTLSNEEYPDVLLDKYKEVPDNYGVEITENIPYYHDVDDDGELDKILFTAVYADDYNNSGYLNLEVNGEEVRDDVTSYYSVPMFIRCDDSNTVFVETSGESDASSMWSYDVSDGVEKISVVEGCMRSVPYDGRYAFDILTNPEAFYIEKYTDVLSTVAGYKKYCINDEGIPEPEEDIYVFSEENMVELTLLDDVEAYVCDEFEVGKDTITLKKGEDVVYFATDDDEYAYLECEDGEVCCVEVEFDTEKTYFSVDGKNIEDLFDGLFYAG